MRDLNHLAYVRGDYLYRRGRFARAAKWFQRALDHCPGDWQALWALADCFSEMKKPRKAYSYYRKALPLASKQRQADLLFNIGNALFDQARYSAAIAYYDQIPSGHPVASKAAQNRLLALSHKQAAPKEPLI